MQGRQIYIWLLKDKSVLGADQRQFMQSPILPVELWERILQFLDSYEDLLRCSATCKALQTVGREDLIWKAIHQRHFSRKLSDLPEIGASQWYGHTVARLQANKAAISGLNRLVSNASPDQVGVFDDPNLSMKTLDAFTPHRIRIDLHGEREPTLRFNDTTQADAQEVLTKNYWASELQSYVFRREACGQLMRLARGEMDENFEDALLIFAQFRGTDPLLVSTLCRNSLHLSLNHALQGQRAAGRYSYWYSNSSHTWLSSRTMFIATTNARRVRQSSSSIRSRGSNSSHTAP